MGEEALGWLILIVIGAALFYYFWQYILGIAISVAVLFGLYYIFKKSEEGRIEREKQNAKRAQSAAHDMLNSVVDWISKLQHPAWDQPQGNKVLSEIFNVYADSAILLGYITTEMNADAETRWSRSYVAKLSDNTVSEQKIDFWTEAESRKIADLLRNRQFELALKQANSRIERYPDEADGYLLRFLANQEYATVDEILWKGFPDNENTDFQSALFLSTETMRRVMIQIQNRMQQVSEALLVAEDKYLADFRDSLCIEQEKEHLASIGKAKRVVLRNLYDEIKSAEVAIDKTKRNCEKSLNAAKKRLEDDRDSFIDIYESLKNTGSLESSNYETLKAKIEKIFADGKQAIEDYGKAKENYVRTIQIPSRKREYALKKIDLCLKEWRDQNDSGWEMLRKLDRGTAYINARKEEIQLGVFLHVKEQFGEEVFLHILKRQA